MRTFSGWLCATASFGLLAAGATAANAAQPLNWSAATVGVGYCNNPNATLCNTGPGGLVTYNSEQSTYNYNYNASANAADPSYGLAHSSANPGAGVIGMPELHSDTTGGHGPGGYSWDYAITQGVQGFTWTNANSITLDVSAFVATLDVTIGGSPQGYGQAGGAVAILSSAIENLSVGGQWVNWDDHYGFSADCNTAGAIAIGETGIVNGQGAHSVSVAPSACGQSTFTLNQGDTFYVWARLGTFRLYDGYTDASHTFSVNLSPDLDPAVTQLLADNLEPTAPLQFGSSAPEPASWALMIGGFGLVGASLRRRRAVVAA